MVGSPSAQAVAVVNDGFSCIDTGYPCQLMLLEYLRVHLLLLALVYVKGGHMMRCY
jgi:hypothetical protein